MALALAAENDGSLASLTGIWTARTQHGFLRNLAPWGIPESGFLRTARLVLYSCLIMNPDLSNSPDPTAAESAESSGDGTVPQSRSGCPGQDRPVSTQPLKVNYGYALGLFLAHLMACQALIPWFFSWTTVAISVAGMYFFGVLGINVCFHRLLSHRSFECPKWFEYVLATLGTCCGQESPAWWAAVHRLHHRHTDEQPDPHSPNVGLLWAHAGWICAENRDFATREKMESYVRDLMRQPYYRWLERTLNWVLVHTVQQVVFFLPGFTIGWGLTRETFAAFSMGCSVLVWGVFVRMIVVQHLTWGVTSLGHRWGYRNFDTPDDSVNNLFFGFVASGDGWHNNHHASQRYAKHGFKWWEIDLAYYVICLFEKIGLVWNVVRPETKPEALPAQT